MAGTHSHSVAPLSRRTFLAASGLVIAGSVAAPLLGPRTAAAHDEEACGCLTAWAGIWAVAQADGRYFALAGEVDTGSLEIHELIVGPSDQVEAGPHYPVAFPKEFVPATLHGVGKRLLVGGAVVEEAERMRVDYAIRDSRLRESEYLIGYNPPFSGIVDVSLNTWRPALFEVAGNDVRELPVGDAARQVGWGAVTALATVSDTGIALLIEGSATMEEAYAERAIVAETVDNGSTWFSDTVATDLGEGWPGALVVAGDLLVAVTVDQSERRTIFQRMAGRKASWVAANAEEKGVVLGAVSGRGGEVVVLGANSDRIRRQSYDPVAGTWIAPVSDVRVSGEVAHAILAIGGSPSEWIAICESFARIVNEAA